MAESNKYMEALSQYKGKLVDSVISEKVNDIIAQKFASNNNQEVYKTIYSCIDNTSLNATDTRETIWEMVEKVNDFEGSRADMKNVAAICVYPNMVPVVKEALTADVKIATVTGGFPASQTFSEVKIVETSLAVAIGADEIDIVLNLGEFFAEAYEEVSEEIMEQKDACRDAQLKVILETGALQTAEKIRTATVLALYSGADFIKTSTGKGYPGASLEAVYVICNILREYQAKTGRKVGIKVSGGVSTTKDAVKYYTLVKEILGEDYMNSQYFRIGASKLVSNLLNEIK